MSEIKKVVLAYSGGLDTSVIIPWLKEHYDNCEVIAVSADVGQGSELEGLEEKALKTGASKLYVEDLADEFVNDYIFPTLKAGAKYEGYLLGTSFARPIIAKRIVEIALKEGADAIAHGCTGKGNDQVRFELAIKAFAPGMKIIAPWRVWELDSREKEIDYAEAHNIPLKINRETNYSKDKNLWHLSHEGLDLEDPSLEPQYEKDGFLEMSVSPMQAPDEPTYVSVDFHKGVPVAVDGVKMKGSDIVKKLNELGGKNGIGLLDLVENRLVGMKCRGVYETPGGAILYHAHEVLETLCLDKMTAHKKAELAITFGELVYNGQWFTPLRRAISAFVDSTQETVTGTVKLKLYKGNIINAGVTSPNSLYSMNIATFGESDYNQMDSQGFINLYGLPIKVRALMEQGLLK
ncbi:Argininosuccinate synthase [bioreactor metagenome]|uniref:argininosuccinate synthase n=1 Tax=bioreactor metagenome TaxID=1076179 RepID=A0A644ZVF7_9ZZZZ